MTESENKGSGGESGPVVKDSAYYAEIRQAVGRGAPTLLLGTSTRALHRSVDRLQGDDRAQRLGAEPLTVRQAESDPTVRAEPTDPMMLAEPLESMTLAQSENLMAHQLAVENMAVVKYRRLAKFAIIFYGMILMLLALIAIITAVGNVGAGKAQMSPLDVVVGLIGAAVLLGLSIITLTIGFKSKSLKKRAPYDSKLVDEVRSMESRLMELQRALGKTKPPAHRARSGERSEDEHPSN